MGRPGCLLYFPVFFITWWAGFSEQLRPPVLCGRAWAFVQAGPARPLPSLVLGEIWSEIDVQGEIRSEIIVLYAR